MSESDFAPIEALIGRKDIPNDTKSVTEQDSSVSFLDLVILSMLETASMTGYVLKKRLLELYHLKTSYGTLYPRLKELEKEGILTNSNDYGKFATRSSGTSYALTPLGKIFLDQNLRKFNGFLQKVPSRNR
jgi:DNA-binding PadR family transcriptional regulator